MRTRGWSPCLTSVSKRRLFVFASTTVCKLDDQRPARLLACYTTLCTLINLQDVVRHCTYYSDPVGSVQVCISAKVFISTRIQRTDYEETIARTSTVLNGKRSSRSYGALYSPRPLRAARLHSFHDYDEASRLRASLDSAMTGDDLTRAYQLERPRLSRAREVVRTGC